MKTFTNDASWVVSYLKAHAARTGEHTPVETMLRVAESQRDALAALESLFEHCAMTHRYWGEGSNSKEADAAIEFGRAVLAKAKGEA